MQFASRAPVLPGAILLLPLILAVPAQAAENRWWESPDVELPGLVEGEPAQPTTAKEANTEPEAGAEQATVLDSMLVTGAERGVGELTGSGVYLDRDAITTQGYGDINRVLRQIPGVYVREEDGYGLFPNVSLRGVDPGRSAKVTLMEDGILTAPAPYSDPSAYYAPNIGRMAGLEVLKGSSQVRFGPHSTGGVINYLSTPIPDTRSGLVRSHYGVDGDFMTHGWAGETASYSGGRFGWLVEGYFREADGFKELDGPNASVGPDAGDTGFRRTEPMVKLAWEPAGDFYQRLEFKYGTSDMDANETYLGLSEADFAANPYRRYAGSRFDNIQTAHERMYLRHFLQFDGGAGLTSTVYRNDFHRNWFKINSVNSGAGNTSLGQALAGSNGGDDLAVLRGEAAGTLNYRNNNREYYLQGVDVQLQQPFQAGSVSHKLRTGLRFHQDRIFRFQHDEAFTQDAAGVITGHTVNEPGSNSNREHVTDALSFFVEDRIAFGDFSLMPGIRVESLDWHYEEFDSTPVQRDGDRTLVGGGMGFNWILSTEATLFGGAYRGFSPPGPSSSTGTANEQEAETSLSAELGARLHGANTLTTEVVLFATRFDNLIVSGNLGASGTADGGAVGEVNSHGVEFVVHYNPGVALGWVVSTPLSFTTTWTRAEIGNDSNSADAESIFNGGGEGKQLPYIPEWQASLNAGIRSGIWTVDTAVHYVDDAFATALNTNEQIVQTSGGPVADARGGTIDSFVTVDMSLGVQVNVGTRLFVNAHNLLDREYLASRLPEGPRPGAPRTAVAGIELSF